MKISYGQLHDSAKQKLKEAMLLRFMCNPKIKNPEKAFDEFVSKIIRNKRTKKKWHNYIFYKIQEAEKAKQLVMKKSGKKH